MQRELKAACYPILAKIKRNIQDDDAKQPYSEFAQFEVEFKALFWHCVVKKTNSLQQGGARISVRAKNARDELSVLVFENGPTVCFWVTALPQRLESKQTQTWDLECLAVVTTSKEGGRAKQRCHPAGQASWLARARPCSFRKQMRFRPGEGVWGIFWGSLLLSRWFKLKSKTVFTQWQERPPRPRGQDQMLHESKKCWTKTTRQTKGS